MEKAMVIAALVALACVDLSSGEVFTVGDKAGWTIIGNVNYTAWADKQTIRVGDLIVSTTGAINYSCTACNCGSRWVSCKDFKYNDLPVSSDHERRGGGRAFDLSIPCEMRDEWHGYSWPLDLGEPLYDSPGAIVFVYNKNFHNVMEVSKDDYKACNNGSPLATYTTGNDSIPIKRRGHHFFICGVPGHCGLGQKVDIRVPKLASSAAPFGAPAAAPFAPATGSASSPAPGPRTSGAPATTAASKAGFALPVLAFAFAAAAAAAFGGGGLIIPW